MSPGETNDGCLSSEQSVPRLIGTARGQGIFPNGLHLINCPLLAAGKMLIKRWPRIVEEHLESYGNACLGVVRVFDSLDSVKLSLSYCRELLS
jgi:hypothetical protein